MGTRNKLRKRIEDGKASTDELKYAAQFPQLYDDVLNPKKKPMIKRKVGLDGR